MNDTYEALKDDIFTAFLSRITDLVNPRKKPSIQDLIARLMAQWKAGQWVERLVTHDIDDQEKWSTLSTVIRSGD